MIDESKILAFIEKNDNRRGARLDQYKELIKRLLSHKIAKKDIYEFIKKEDDKIGSQINFYKYISRNIKIKVNSDMKQSSVSELIGHKKTVVNLSESQNKEVLPKEVSILTALKQDFDLMDYDDE